MSQSELTHQSDDALSRVLEQKRWAFLPVWAAGILLAAMPALSFALQLWFSSRDHTLPLLFTHFTVSYVDWVFVPFNFFAVYAVNWRRGALLFLMMILSLAFNIMSHAYWQYALVENPGHMFGQGHVLLRAGWVHVCFATIQMTLILAFLFVRQPSSKCCGLLTCLCCVYFVSAGISGYVMNKGFMITDVIMVSLGLGITLIYPRFGYAVPKGGL
jgi:hypothetical protein